MLWLTLVSLVSVEVGASTEPYPAGTADLHKPHYQIVDESVRVADVVVSARRGAASIPPEMELSGQEIDALGAWDIGEVLRRLGETLVLGDEPMVLINGKRVANSAAFSGFPPDAVVRAEILPLGAGASYGSAPGQRVVNLVLQRNFSSYDGRVMGERPVRGGTSSLSADARRAAIANETTHQFGLKVARETSLRAEERDRDALSEHFDGRITLRPQTETFAANATFTRSFGDWSGVFSADSQLRDSYSVARLGSELVNNKRQNRNIGGSAGFTGSFLGWSAQLNLNAQESRSQEFGFSDTRSRNRSVVVNSSAHRAIMSLPAGHATINIGGNFMNSQSTVDRNKVHSSSNYQTREARISIALPISKTSSNGPSGLALGDVQLSLGGSIRDVSGGGGDEVNGNLLWAPLKRMRLNAVWSITNETASDIQRFEPLYYDTSRVVFDFREGKAVEIIPILGGNPNLRPPRWERQNLTATLGPFSSWSLAGNISYQRSESSDGIERLPEITEDVERLFPDKFQRDDSGRLISIDYRPMNLSSSQIESFTSSLNFRLPLEVVSSSSESTVLRVALSHNLRTKNSVVLVGGRPELNRLKGDGGGLSRQELSMMLDARRGRWGVNATARWQDSYRTRRLSGFDGPSDLITAPYTSVDLKLSYQLISSGTREARSGDMAGTRRTRSGLQWNVDIQNLFDARPQAHLGDGRQAPGYGGNSRDPIGRTIRVSLQRRF